MTRRSAWRLSAAAVVVLLAACAGDPDPTAPVIEDGATTDPAGAWELVEAQPPIDVPTDARVTMEVVAAGDEWEVSGTSACNSYFGRVTTDGNSWRSEGFGGTDMGCDEPRMAAERAYLDSLGGIDAWTLPSAEELVLTGPDVELRFAALAPAPTAELTSTTWILDGLVAGTGPDASVSSTPASAEEATLQLGADGTVHASTGCRTFDGEWDERGDEILLTTFGVREDSPNVADDGTTTCDEAAVAQEDHVLSVLGDGFRAEIEGQRLTLISRDGLGLIYRTAESDGG